MCIKEWIRFYVELLFICSPFIAVPSFLTLTKGQSLAEKKKTGAIASLAVAVILLAAAIGGKFFLELLGIRVAAFQLAGGFVIFLLALSMLQAKGDSDGAKAPGRSSSIAIVPLAIPLIAGPGAISSVIVNASTFMGAISQLYIACGIILVAATLWLCLYFALVVEHFLGVLGLAILTRIGGLILAAIAMEIMAKGLSCLFPGLIGR